MSGRSAQLRIALTLGGPKICRGLELPSSFIA